MKKLLWLFVVPILMTSCKKDSDDAVVPAASIKTCTLIETRDSLSNNQSSGFEYDASGRISKIINFDSYNGLLLGYRTLSYNGNNNQIKTFNAAGTETGSGYFVLNSNGYMTLSRGSRKDTLNGIPVINQDSIIITYNQSGQMLTYTGHYWSTFENDSSGGMDIRKTSHEYASGRLSKQNLEVYITGQTQLFEEASTSYFYDNNSPTVTSNPAFNFSSGPGVFILGKIQSDKIPVRAEVTSSWQGQTSSYTNTFYATVDEKGNPVRFRMISDNGGIFPARTTLYSYSCP
jgi:hypothetical protein